MVVGGGGEDGVVVEGVSGRVEGYRRSHPEASAAPLSCFGLSGTATKQQAASCPIDCGSCQLGRAVAPHRDVYMYVPCAIIVQSSVDLRVAMHATD